VTPNTANCDQIVGFELTNVRSYPAAASPNGTFDPGGNAIEWEETITGGFPRVLRGAAFNSPPTSLSAAFRSSDAPFDERSHLGFRVAASALPAAVPSLGCEGLLLLASVLGLWSYRRARRLRS